MNRLIVIGNGFDMRHGLKTSYTDFSNYFREHDKSSYMKFTSLYENHCLWNDLERTLGELTYDDDILDKFHYLLVEPTDYGWSDAANFDYQYEVEEHLNTIDSLKSNLCEWIKTIEYDNVSPKFIFKPDDFFINFNYTLILEKVYNINSDRILHIHNKVGEELIVGHSDYYHARIDDHHNPDHFDFRVQESANYYNSYMDSQRKCVEDIIDDNYDILNKQYSEIIIIGHSMGDVDFDYFKTLALKNLNVMWIIVYYDEKDIENYKDKCAAIGIPRFKIISYCELEEYLEENL